jgi:hypothetical protein
MQDRVMELTVLHDDAAAQAQAARQELANLREQLRQWSGTVERALEALASGARELAD